MGEYEQYFTYVFVSHAPAPGPSKPEGAVCETPQELKGAS